MLEFTPEQFEVVGDQDRVVLNPKIAASLANYVFGFNNTKRSGQPTFNNKRYAHNTRVVLDTTSLGHDSHGPQTSTPEDGQPEYFKIAMPTSPKTTPNVQFALGMLDALDADERANRMGTIPTAIGFSLFTGIAAGVDLISINALDEQSIAVVIPTTLACGAFMKAAGSNLYRRAQITEGSPLRAQRINKLARAVMQAKNADQVIVYSN